MTTTAPLMRKSLRMRPFFCGWRDRVFYTTRTCYLREQLTLNQWVLGSSPRWCTRIPRNFIVGYFCFAKTLHRPARRSIKAKQQGINVRSYFYINRSSGGGQRQRAPNIQQIFGALTSAGVGAVTKRIKPGVH